MRLKGENGEAKDGDFEYVLAKYLGEKRGQESQVIKKESR